MQDARPGLAKMYRVPPDRAWWPAVGAPLERGVRPHSAAAEELLHTLTCDNMAGEALKNGLPARALLFFGVT